MPWENAKPLPGYLVQRYHGWKATTYSNNKGWYRRLAKEGQRPRAMVISCCDSRVNVTALFEADQGEFFIHRNIANLVPPHAPDGLQHGTSAAVEYPVLVFLMTGNSRSSKSTLASCLVEPMLNFEPASS